MKMMICNYKIPSDRRKTILNDDSFYRSTTFKSFIESFSKFFLESSGSLKIKDKFFHIYSEKSYIRNIQVCIGDRISGKFSKSWHTVLSGIFGELG